MSTLDTVFIGITATTLSLFFLVGVGLVIYTWVVFRRIVKKAEMAIEGVENVTQMVKDVSSKGFGLSLVKLIKYLMRSGKKG